MQNSWMPMDINYTKKVHAKNWSKSRIFIVLHEDLYFYKIHVQVCIYLKYSMYVVCHVCKENNDSNTRFMISNLIISLTKLSIVIGSPDAYLSCNRCTIAWVSNCTYPIWPFFSWTPVIVYPRDLHINYACFSGFLYNVS